MSVKTKFYLKRDGGSVHDFIGNLEAFGLPEIQGGYEKLIDQGGDGTPYQAPTGIVELTGGSLDLYWDNRVPGVQQRTHHQLFAAALHQKEQRFLVVFATGWSWAFSAFVEKFSPQVEKEKKDRAKLTLLPVGRLVYSLKR